MKLLRMFLLAFWCVSSLFARDFIEYFPDRFTKRLPDGRPWPGDGMPGKLLPYDISPSMRKHMEKYNFIAGKFKRDSIPPNGYGSPYHIDGSCPTDTIPYLLYRPQNPRRLKLPLVIYFGGLGERGFDLERQFRHKTLFQKVTSREFQQKHPCWLFCPMLPSDGQIATAMPEMPTNLADLVCDTMYAIMRSEGTHLFDTNRLYATGFSAGGDAAFMLESGYPKRFAAVVPVSAWLGHRMVNDTPGNVWLIFNADDFGNDICKSERAKFAKNMRDRGGEYKESSYPDPGHNAWDATWKEDAVWDWMFSKTTDGSPVPDTTSGTTRAATSQTSATLAATLPKITCTASIRGLDKRTQPQFAADGLEGSAYVSAEVAHKGDWFRADFDSPFVGKVHIKTGNKTGKHILSSGRVETSSDGKNWAYVGTFSRNTGECIFRVSGKIIALRILPGTRQPETLAIREITLLP